MKRRAILLMAIALCAALLLTACGGGGNGGSGDDSGGLSGRYANKIKNYVEFNSDGTCVAKWGGLTVDMVYTLEDSTITFEAAETQLTTGNYEIILKMFVDEPATLQEDGSILCDGDTLIKE